MIREWLTNRNDKAIEDAFFQGDCPEFFSVDWRQDDEEIVAACSECIAPTSLECHWQGDQLILRFGDRKQIVQSRSAAADGDQTIRGLNELLNPDYEIRFLVCSHGSDAAGFVVLPASEWQTLESDCELPCSENFVRLKQLPNIFAEMRDTDLPNPARLRHRRMIDRNRKKGLGRFLRWIKP